jgi:elongation factor P
MLAYNEIKERKYIIIEGEPYEVLSSHVFRKQQRKPVNQTKLRNLITGGMRMDTFHVNDSVEEAELETKKVKFIFKKFNPREKRTEFWFSDIENPNRFEISETLIGDQQKYLKDGLEISALVFEEQIIGIKLPVKVEYKVIEAPPAVKGNSATGANKTIILETGLAVNAPIFVNEGDVVRINTETGEYGERV